MAYGDIASGVSGLLGGVESGVDFLRKLEEDKRKKLEEERRQRAEQLQMLLHGSQLLEAYPEAGEGLAGLVPEPTLGRLRTAATQRDASLAKLYQQAGVEGATPDVARLLSKRSELVKPFIERSERNRIGGLLSSVESMAAAEKTADPSLTQYQAWQRALSKMPGEARASILGLGKELDLVTGARPSQEDERKSLFGQLIGNTFDALTSGKVDEDAAVRFMSFISLQHLGRPLSLADLESMFPDRIAQLRNRQAFSEAFSKVQGGAVGAMTPLAIPGAPTPQDIEVSGRGRIARSTALGGETESVLSLRGAQERALGALGQQREKGLDDLTETELRTKAAELAQTGQIELLPGYMVGGPEGMDLINALMKRRGIEKIQLPERMPTAIPAPRGAMPRQGLMSDVLRSRGAVLPSRETAPSAPGETALVFKAPRLNLKDPVTAQQQIKDTLLKYRGQKVIRFDAQGNRIVTTMTERDIADELERAYPGIKINIKK